MTYSLSGEKWGTPTTGVTGGQVSWSFVSLFNSTSFYSFDAAISNASYQALVRAAFQVWEDVANIDFVETADSSSVNIRLGMDFIDGAFNTVGQAQYSFSVNGTTMNQISKAEIRFDTSETFSPDASHNGSLVNFFAVAVHEIGHAIGMGHVNDTTEIMNPTVVALVLGDGDILGAQTLYGSNGLAGYNIMNGTPNADVLTGGTANDYIVGYEGNDFLTGNGGNDYIHGNQGSDTIYGGDGNDEVRGGKEVDTVSGGNGNDEVRGGNEGDLLSGEAGNDSFYGGQGNDSIDGGSGDDLIYGLKGADVLTGGSGADTFGYVSGNSSTSGGGIDSIVDFVSGTDKIDILELAAGSASNFVELAGQSSYANALSAAQVAISASSGVYYIDVGVGSSHYLFGDENGDKIIDFAIQVNTDFTYTDII